MANKAAELLLKIKTTGEEALDSTREKLAMIGQVATVAFTALAAVITKAVMDYREQEKAVNALTQAMVRSGVYTKELKQDYLDQATALQKLTTFGDEQIIAAQAAAQQQIGNTKITKEMTLAILDFAQAQGMDAASAANLVGKAIGTSTNALARYGIEINTSASSTDKMAQAIQGLNSKFGGQAQAAASGLGALAQLKNIFSDISETLGERVAPTVIAVANMFKGLATDSQSVNSNMNVIVGAFNMVANAGVRLLTVVGLIGDALGITFAAATQVITSQANIIKAVLTGNFSAIPGLVKTSISTMGDVAVQGFDQMKGQLEKRSAAMYEALNAMDVQHNENKAANDAMETERMAAAAQARNDQANIKHAEQRQLEMERKLLEQEENLAFMGLSEEQNLALQAQYLDKEIAAAQSAYDKKRLMNEKSSVLKQMQDVKDKAAEAERQKIFDEQRIKDRESTLNTIATMQSSSNALLAGIGKAAALTEIAIQTPVAIARALAAFPPPINFVAAGAVGAAMAMQAARVSGIKLAEGGIVPARPGGTSAIIGEAGQAEAVIPLDRMKEFGAGGGGGTNITLIVNGGLLGDEATAYQLAKAIDNQLYKLRTNNESVSLDRIT
jgi:hypothetical protein